MNPEHFRQVERLYHSALEKPPAERAAFLKGLDDPELRREVEALLAVSWQDTETLAGEPAAAAAESVAIGSQLGPYRLEAVLGAGGMGQVYRALDTRLGRQVAIKFSAQQFSARFEREARAVAALNHPHICTLYDVGVLPSGSVYMVTELVEGTTLRELLKSRPAPERCLEIARQVLEALRAAHGAGIIHRDLKPENIMVRFDGYVKVLDFGLAKRIAAPGKAGITESLSVPGQILGTVAYMPPEQIQGQDADARSDLFSFGIMLYEMLEGAHPWPRKSAVDLMHAILHDPAPPANPVIEKLLSKDPADRYASAEAVLEALKTPAPNRDSHGAAPTRLIVLPFRILRKDESSDFLAVSLPDAITNSLAAIDSLVVRSTMAASPEADLKTIAEKAQVDAILTGALLSDGENLRITTQLVQARDGKVLWSGSSQGSMRDIFQLQDNLVNQIVESLKLPLTARERGGLKHDVPASALSYELYLRANHLALSGYDPQNMILARDLYLRSVEEDPKYAPAWAGLGRIYRVIGKYGVGNPAENVASAEGAFQKAFSLNPDLPLAHNLYTSLETDTGRALKALERLLSRAQIRHNDPQLLAGLVHACRYCGLLDASIAAHDLARRLDPQISTTAAYAWLNRCDFQQALDCSEGPGYFGVKMYALKALGRKQEMLAYLLEEERKAAPIRQLALSFSFTRALTEGQQDKGLAALDELLELPGPLTSDPESFFFIGRSLADAGLTQRAMAFLSRTLDNGYMFHYSLLHDPSFDSLRGQAGFTELVSRAAAMDLKARAVFLDNSGDKLLGVHVERKPPEPAPTR